MYSGAMNFHEAVAYLDGLISEATSQQRYAEIKLERMKDLLRRLGDPHRSLRVVLVAGTKGKGSTCAMISSILMASGMTVGLHTKPHLEDVRERIQVNGRPVRRETFARLVARLQPHSEAMREGPWGLPSYFEATVALALLHFSSVPVDLAVLEVGLGGRLDATNVTDPLVSVITPISLDHTEILGNTVRAIAAEKAGIIREHGTVVSAPQGGEAAEVIQATCREQQARLVQVGEEVIWKRERSTREGQQFKVFGRLGIYEDLWVPLLGAHQVVNAATAVATVECLQELGIPVPPAAIRAGLSRVRWPARVELFSRRPYILLDVAHNPASMGALRAVLEEHFPGRRVILVYGMLKTKDYRGTTAILAPCASHVIATRPHHPHALDAAVLAEEVGRFAPSVEVVDNQLSAMERALSLAGREDVICVTGSFYLVGEIRRALRYLIASGASSVRWPREHLCGKMSSSENSVHQGS
ncbi:MAG: folylpolyglutamate synthase/dihydrofolate synthase family protein [Armatimonadota bacterium]|nr:folylpolyglutamate synthase/dihydrofolate synthase family protein [Armatimonadota bacterium]